MANFNDLKKKIVLDKVNSVPQIVVELPSNHTKASLLPMKVKDHKDLIKSFEKNDEYLMNEALDAILVNCVISVDDKPFDLDTICNQDRTFLLIQIRKITFGPVATIAHQCPVSQKVIQDIEINLDELKVDYYQGSEIKRELLITDAVKIVLSPFTRKDEKQVEKWMKPQGTNLTQTDLRYAQYASLIHGAWFKTDAGEWEEVLLTFAEKQELLLNHCSRKDLDEFNKYLKEELDFGIRLKFPFKTEHYENAEEEASPIAFFMV